MTENKLKDVRVNGHVVVIGIGDTALDCARSAFRQGAERVSVVFRRGFSDLRAGDDLFTTSFFEGINTSHKNRKNISCLILKKFTRIE